MLKIKEDLYVNPELISKIYIKPEIQKNFYTIYNVMIDNVIVFKFTNECLGCNAKRESIKKVKEIVKLIEDYKSKDVKKEEQPSVRANPDMIELCADESDF